MGNFLAPCLRSVVIAGLFLFIFTAQAQTVLKVSAIPDEAPTELQRKFAPLGKYLEQATGMKVEFTPVTDYAAVVEALGTKKIDMAWLGGFTFVQSKIRSNGTTTPIVQRPFEFGIDTRWMRSWMPSKSIVTATGSFFAGAICAPASFLLGTWSTLI